MSELLNNPDSIADNDLRREITALAEQLQTDIQQDEWQSLLDCREACQRAAELAREHPEAVRLLTPVLGDILYEAINLPTESTALNMVAGGALCAIAT